MQQATFNTDAYKQWKRTLGVQQFEHISMHFFHTTDALLDAGYSENQSVSIAAHDIVAHYHGAGVVPAQHCVDFEAELCAMWQAFESTQGSSDRAVRQ